MQPAASPPRWQFVLAFSAIYLIWGTTYLAIKVGVEVFPPALFGGVRIFLAGLLLLAGLALFGRPVRLRSGELLWCGLTGACLFIGGNGLITLGEKTVDSGVASVLVATTPLWLALLETAWPSGERLRAVGWLGLLLGLAGVGLLLALRPADAVHAVSEAGAWTGPLLVIGSAFCWGLGSFVIRHWRGTAPLMTAAAYQMVLGGGAMALIGLAIGEVGQLRPEMFHGRGMVAFWYLLFVGSLCGFVAYAWLLGHVSAVLVGTYAYVNPMVAILVGWLLGGETLGAGVIAGMIVILAGVALVRTGGTARQVTDEPAPGVPTRAAALSRRSGPRSPRSYGRPGTR